MVWTGNKAKPTLVCRIFRDSPLQALVPHHVTGMHLLGLARYAIHAAYDCGMDGACERAPKWAPERASAQAAAAAALACSQGVDREAHGLFERDV